MMTDEELVGRVLYGGATPADRAELARRLAADPALRRDYVDDIRLHVFLSGHPDVVSAAARQPVLRHNVWGRLAAALVLFFGLAAVAGVVATATALVARSGAEDESAFVAESVVTNGQVGALVASPSTSSASAVSRVPASAPSTSSASSVSSASLSRKGSTVMNTFTKLVASAASAVTLASSASGEAKIWVGGSNTWQTASAWSPSGVPATADNITITNGTAEYVPGGDLTIAASGSITLGPGGRFVQTGGIAWMQIAGKVLINSGELDMGTAGQMNLSGSLVISNGTFNQSGALSLLAGGSLEFAGGTWTRTGTVICANDTRVTLSGGNCSLAGSTCFGSAVVSISGGTVDFESGNLPLSSTFAVSGGRVTVPGELHYAGNSITLAGGTISCGIIAPQAESASLGLNGGSIVTTNSNWNGFYQPTGAYLDFTSGSTSTVTFVGVDATNVYTTYFAGSSPKIRYESAVVKAADFTNLFTVTEGTTAGTNSVTIALAGGAVSELVFDGACTVSDVGSSNATLSATVAKAGDPAATVYACWGTDDGSSSLAGWQNVVALGTATNGVAYSNVVTVTDGMFYYYRMALSNATGVVFAKASPAAFYAGDNVNAFTGENSVLASDADNWSKGTVPGSGDTVVFTPVIAAQEMTWDAASPMKVGKWIQPGPFPSGKTSWAVTFATTPASPLEIAGDCRLDGGRWTHVGPVAEPSNAVAVTVGGDLYVGTNAQINAGNGVENDARGEARGYYLAGPGYLDGTGASYGGEGATNAVTYGSILNPLFYGSSGRGDNKFFAGGGLVLLKVGGKTTICGSILANGFGWPVSGSGASSGGTVNLTTGSLVGDGVIAANGGTDTLKGSGSGGRVRVKLTETGATYDGFTGAITAYGKPGLAITNTVASAAGTICLQMASDKADTGTVIVDNPELAGTNNLVRATHLPAMRASDVSLIGTSWIVRNHGAVRVMASVKVDALEVIGNGKVYLNGKTLRANTAAVGGEKLSPGHYTAARYPAYLFGDGALDVGRSGFFIIVR